MKILYLSVHSILEHDEIKLLTELGHEVFSPGGAYQNPHAPGDKKRPPIPDAPYFDHLCQVAIQCSKEHLHPELIEWADVIMVMHRDDWITNNWEQMKHKTVIWRTIGQSISGSEDVLKPYREQGLKVVRCSDRERFISSNIGADAFIYFYKDPEEFYGYEGTNKIVMTVAQGMPSDTRREHLNYHTFLEATRGFPTHLYGPDNEISGLGGGLVDYEHMKMALRMNRVYMYTGTQPASYTLGFIEAMMTGIPIVAIGEEHAQYIYHDKLYEIPYIIQNGVNGYFSDNIDKLREYIDLLLNDQKLAKQIGEAGRQTAISIFGKDIVKEQWKTFLNSLTNQQPQ